MFTTKSQLKYDVIRIILCTVMMMKKHCPSFIQINNLTIQFLIYLQEQRNDSSFIFQFNYILCSLVYNLDGGSQVYLYLFLFSFTWLFRGDDNKQDEISLYKILWPLNAHLHIRSGVHCLTWCGVLLLINFCFFTGNIAWEWFCSFL